MTVMAGARPPAVHGSLAPARGPEGTSAGSGADVANGASGISFFGVAGLLALVLAALPKLSFRLRLARELCAPVPCLGLLERPG
jgi:hypothetical protein